MSKRTRLFVLVASSTLIAGVGTAGVASYVGFGPLAQVGGTAASDLSYIPAAAEVVAFADVRRVMDSDLRQKLHSDLNRTAGRQNQLQEIGLDLERDVDTVVVATLPAAEGTAGQHLPLLLARGRFDNARIEATIRNAGGAPTEHRGYRFVSNDRVAVAFIETGFIVAGGPAAVRLSLDTRATGSGSITGDASLVRLVRRVDDAATWVVADFQALQSTNLLPGAMAGQLPAITWLAASGDVGDGLSARIFAEGRDERAAQDLQEVVRGFVALARMQSGQEAALNQLLNSIELTGEGKTVTLSFAIPAEFFDRLKNAARPKTPVAPISPRRAPRQAPIRPAA